MEITRVLRVLEYSADSIEAIQNILENNKYNNPINGSIGGGFIVATCDPSTILFADGKYRLMRYLEYRGKDRYSNREERVISGTERINETLALSKVPANGEKVIEQNGYYVTIKSGIIGIGFDEVVDIEE